MHTLAQLRARELEYDAARAALAHYAEGLADGGLLARQTLGETSLSRSILQAQELLQAQDAVDELVGGLCLELMAAEARLLALQEDHQALLDDYARLSTGDCIKLCCSHLNK